MSPLCTETLHSERHFLHFTTVILVGIERHHFCTKSLPSVKNCRCAQDRLADGLGPTESRCLKGFERSLSFVVKPDGHRDTHRLSVSHNVVPPPTPLPAAPLTMIADCALSTPGFYRKTVNIVLPDSR